jgi:TadE-like protein.
MKRSDRFNKKINASLTVEAAFVMPIVFFTIIALMYLAFYLHDRNRMQTVADLSMQKAGLTLKHNADIVTGRVGYQKIGERGVFYLISHSSKNAEEQIKKYLVNQLSSGLFLLKPEEIEVECNQRKVSAKIVAKSEVPLPIFHGLFQQYSKTMIAGDFSIHNPTETIRCMEVILDTGSNIKGIDKLKNSLEKYIK